MSPSPCTGILGLPRTHPSLGKGRETGLAGVISQKCILSNWRSCLWWFHWPKQDMGWTQSRYGDKPPLAGEIKHKARPETGRDGTLSSFEICFMFSVSFNFFFFWLSSAFVAHACHVQPVYSGRRTTLVVCSLLPQSVLGTKFVFFGLVWQVLYTTEPSC